MKEITKVVTVQETYIDILPDDSVEMIEEDVMTFKKYCEKRWRAESTADDVVANVQLFIRDLEEKKNDGSRMTREEALAILDTIPTIGEQVDALEMAIEALQERKMAKRIDCIGHYKCSNCHTWVDDVDKYCSNCGAKMEGDE